MDREQLARLTADERAWLNELPFRLSVEGAFRITGRGTVIAGVIEQGRVRAGDELELVKAGGEEPPPVLRARCVSVAPIYAPNRDPSRDTLVGVLVKEVAPGDAGAGDELRAAQPPGDGSPGAGPPGGQRPRGSSEPA